MVRGVDMGGPHHLGAARVNHDQLRALADTLLHARGKYRVRRRRIGADHDDDVALFDRVKILRTGRGAEGLTEAVAGGRVTDARTGIDVIIAKTGADQLLNEERLLVGTARRGDAADRVLAVLRLDALELGGGVPDGLLPAHFLPLVGDLGADHRLQDAFLVGRVTPGEATLHAGMAAVCLAVLIRHHANEFFAAHLRLEGAADTAIGAGGDN